MLKIDNKIILIILFILKLAILFIIGGVAYLGVEILWRGYSHFSMLCVGGLCFVLIGLINEFFSWDLSIWKQAGISAIIVTVVEFIAGVILNLILGLNVWSYAGMPFNILGQVCLPYTLAWFFLAIPALILDDVLRWIIFSEEKPHYNQKLN